MYVWRNIPRADGFSPAQLLFGRRQFTALPAVSQAYGFYDIEAAQKNRDKIFNSHIPSHDRGTGFLPDLTPGEQVVIQHPKTGEWSQRGVVISVRSSGQSYEINCDGRICIRGRKLLRRDPLACSVSPGVHNTSAVPPRPVISPIPSTSDRGYVDSGDQRSGRTVWDPHKLSQNRSIMTRPSSSRPGKIPETANPIKTGLSTSLEPPPCFSGIGQASVEALPPCSFALSSACCSASSSGRTIEPIPELGAQNCMKSCSLPDGDIMSTPGAICSPGFIHPVPDIPVHHLDIPGVQMNPRHHTQQFSPVFQQPMQDCRLANQSMLGPDCQLVSQCRPVSPVFKGSPITPPVGLPSIPPVCRSFLGPPMGPPFPCRQDFNHSRVPPLCLPLPDHSSWSTVSPLRPPNNGLLASERCLPSAPESHMLTNHVRETGTESCPLPSSGPLGLSGDQLEVEFPALGRSAQSVPAPVRLVSEGSQTGLQKVLKNESNLKKHSFSGSIHDMKITY